MNVGVTEATEAIHTVVLNFTNTELVHFLDALDHGSDALGEQTARVSARTLKNVYNAINRITHTIRD